MSVFQSIPHQYFVDMQHMKNIFTKTQNIRHFVQSVFLILILWLGYRFYGFVQYFVTSGKTPAVSRPPGVEGFLPISSLMGLRFWVLTGDFNTVHPAGIVLFVTFLAMAFFLKKGFCSWVCPVGFLSEYLWKTGKKIFGRNFKLPAIVDYPLRSVKYIIMFFFVYAAFSMNANDLKNFIYGNYNKIADVEMLLFFLKMSRLTFWVLAGLIVLSLFIQNFWCRYLCPYGALLGLLSVFSPFKITRHPESCTGCADCTAACPAHIRVHQLERIRSDECMACMACIETCPENDTLRFSPAKKSKFHLPVWGYAILLAGIFLLFTMTARLTGHWKNQIPETEYRQLIQKVYQQKIKH